MTKLVKKENCTLRDIAAMAEVSPSTVSRVINNHSTSIKVTEATKQKIFRIVRQFDYSPNINAKRLWSDKTFTIGLVIPAVLERYGTHVFSDLPFTDTLCGIENILAGSPYRLMLIFRNQQYLQTKEYLRLFKEKIVDGLIVWGAAQDDCYLEEIASFPVVLINSFPRIKVDFHRIGTDHEKGSFELTDYMIGRGRRQFLYLGELSGNSISDSRMAGFRRALNKNKLPFAESNLIRCHYTRKAGFMAMDEILNRRELVFDAVCGANDEIALGAFLAAGKHGMKIPADFALAGADGLAQMPDEMLPLTTYKVQSRRMGELAVETLLRIFSGKMQEKTDIMLPPELIISKTV